MRSVRGPLLPLVSSFVLLTPALVAQAGGAASRSLLSRERQVALIRTTAPREIVDQATHYVLEAKGYVKTQNGTNGFSCLVEHEFLDTYEPVCYDAEGSGTTLKARLYREELRAAGVGEAQIKQRIAAAYRDGTLQAPRKPGFAYMMAPDQIVYNQFTGEKGPGPAHLMFYAPYARMADVGGFLGMHAPLVIFEGQPDAFIVVVPGAMAEHAARRP